MYKRILVPLDGSELAERALSYAGAIAKRLKSEIVSEIVPYDLEDVIWSKAIYIKPGLEEEVLFTSEPDGYILWYPCSVKGLRQIPPVSNVDSWDPKDNGVIHLTDDWCTATKTIKTGSVYMVRTSARAYTEVLEEFGYDQNGIKTEGIWLSMPQDCEILAEFNS